MNRAKSGIFLGQSADGNTVGQIKGHFRNGKKNVIRFQHTWIKDMNLFHSSADTNEK